jgi:hypothetical protein
VLILIEADVVENEELGFRAEIGGVGDAAVLQVQLGLWRDPARVALVALLGDRVLHVADHHQRGRLGERIHDRRVRIGIRSMSLSWIAAQPRMLDPSMPKPSSKLLSSSSLIG